jgi:hypothetical protein
MDLGASGRRLPAQPGFQLNLAAELTSPPRCEPVLVFSMRQSLVLLGALAMAVAQPLDAAETAPLAPGKPAGVKPAQANNMVQIYGGVLLFGALLGITIGVSGSSVPPNTATANTAVCCG